MNVYQLKRPWKGLPFSSVQISEVCCLVPPCQCDAVHHIGASCSSMTLKCYLLFRHSPSCLPSHSTQPGFHDSNLAGEETTVCESSVLYFM